MNSSGPPWTPPSRPGSVGVRGSGPLSSTPPTTPLSLSGNGLRRPWCKFGSHWIHPVPAQARRIRGHAAGCMAVQLLTALLLGARPLWSSLLLRSDLVAVPTPTAGAERPWEGACVGWPPSAPIPRPNASWTVSGKLVGRVSRDGHPPTQSPTPHAQLVEPADHLANGVLIGAHQSGRSPARCCPAEAITTSARRYLITGLVALGSPRRTIRSSRCPSPDGPWGRLGARVRCTLRKGQDSSLRRAHN
jgi:hypothetical protein